MTIDEITDYVASLGGVLVLSPQPGDGTPEVAWGDRFFYYAPDGVLPQGQPFATVVTKDYPGEPSSGLGDGAIRVNIDACRRGQGEATDPTVRDRVMPHPVYAGLGWVCVVQPGEDALADVRAMLRDAHAAAKRRYERRRS